MKYHPSFFRYVKQQYMDLVDQVNVDRTVAECLNDYTAVCLGYFFIALASTICAPLFIGALYIEWIKHGRKSYTETFIERL